MSTTQSLNLSTQSSLRLQQASPDEIFEKIRKIRQGVGPEPSLLDQIFRRDYVDAFNQIDVAALRARKDLIEGLADSIKIYIDTHKADLKMRSSAFLIGNFAQLTRRLIQISEDGLVGLVDDYNSLLNYLRSHPDLQEELREFASQKASLRAKRKIEQCEVLFEDLLNTLEDEVKKLCAEVGARDAHN